MTEAKIRFAVEEDAAQIITIYNYYIQNTAYTYEYDNVSEIEYAKRIRKIGEKYPFLVYEIDERVVAYAYLATYKERAAFGWDVEATVYVHKDYHGRNIASELYQALIHLAKSMGYYNIYALIESSNVPSIRFHEKMGFETVGRFPNVGYKFGRWWGLTEQCLNVGDFMKKPQPVRSIKNLDIIEIQEILYENVKCKC